jgi:hypothetical protein
MRFLNGKEEVIDIEITSYGKHLLSKGKFKPVYYSFFDDGVLYDGLYGGVTENQNDIQDRIKNESPRLQCQSNYAGVETQANHLIKDFRDPNGNLGNIQVGVENGILVLQDGTNVKKYAGPTIQATVDKFYSLKYPIGTSDFNTNNAPSWKVNALRGQISSSSNYLTGAYVTERIPQLSLEPVVYQSVIEKAAPDQNLEDIDYTFLDNSYIKILKQGDDIILDLSENNTFYGEQNFDIEVYSVEEQRGSDGQIKQVMTPLYFIKDDLERVVNNILLSDEEIEQNNGNIDTESNISDEGSFSLDPSYVRYFLNIEIDAEIDEDTLCSLTVDKSQGVFGTTGLECNEKKENGQYNTSQVFDVLGAEDPVGGCNE